MSQSLGVLAAIIAGVIGLAIIAVILSKNSNTQNVIQAGGSGLASIINAAVSPITSGANSFGGT